MLAQNTLRHPMTFSFRLEVEDRLEYAVLERAANQIARNHFRLVAPAQTEAFPFSWEPIGQFEILVESHRWGESPQILQRDSHFGREPAIRISLALNDNLGYSELWLQFHHVSCDGIGAMQFIQLLLQHRDCPSQGIPATATQEGRLPHISDKNKTVRTSFRYDCVRTWYYFLHGRPVVLAGKGAQNAGPDTSASAVRRLSLSLSCRILPHFRRTSQKSDLTINDALLGCLFRAVAKWCPTANGQRSGWIRLGVPTNMRVSGQSDSVEIKNDVSMVFVDREIGEISKDQNFLEGIHQEMGLLKIYCAGNALLRALSWLKHIPKTLAYLLKSPQFATTVLITNLGIVFRDAETCRDAQHRSLISSINVFPPLRIGTSVAFGALTLEDQLQISMTYDVEKLGFESASALLEALASEMKPFGQYWTEVAVKPIGANQRKPVSALT